MDPERFVFLDETGASTNMTRRYGWGPRSERLVDATPELCAILGDEAVRRRGLMGSR